MLAADRKEIRRPDSFASIKERSCRCTSRLTRRCTDGLTIPLALLVIGASCGAESGENTFRGVVTYHLIPAKVLRVNEIVKDPEPGTSYIGDEGILLELDRDIDVRANWTVVEVEYYEYEEPKTVQYELLGEEHEITVNYHAVSVVVDGDISEYIEE